ncbi:MAG: hypothetical protein U9Q82_01690 [Chloroflexota bacterium]|nr:hypothetical protein [Chloroflexota bacterium]
MIIIVRQLTHHEADRAIARANRRDFQAFGYGQSRVRVKAAPLVMLLLGSENCEGSNWNKND